MSTPNQAGTPPTPVVPYNPPEAIINTTTNLPPQVKDYYNRALQVTARSYLVYDFFAEKPSMPYKSGNTFIFSRYNPIDPATNPLTEGITPQGAALARVDIKSELKQYGNYVILSDVQSFTVQDATLNAAVERLGYNAGETLDILTRNALSSATSILYCTGGVNVADEETPGYITYEDILTASKILTQQKAIRISPWHTSSQNYMTMPIRSAYYCFLPVNLRNEIISLDQFIPQANYNPSVAETRTLLPAELGQVADVRFLETQNALKVTDGSGEYPEASEESPVYEAFIFGKYAYGNTTLGNLEFIYNPLGSGGASDPLAQRCTAGWKCMFASVILNQDWIIKLVAREKGTFVQEVQEDQDQETN